MESTITFTEALNDRFKNLNVEFILFPENRNLKFKSLESFYSFVCKEADFWNDCTTGSRVSDIRSYFVDIKNHLNNALNQAAINPDSAFSFINTATQRISINRFPCIFSTTEIAKQIKKMYEISPNQADGFASYLIEKPGYGYIQNANFSNKEYVAGVLYAFAFENSEVAKTLSEEEKSARISSIQNLQELVNQSIEELSSETKRVHDISNEEALKIQELQNSFGDKKDQLLSEGRQKIQELENLYGEKLRLSAPAQYWKETKKSYFTTDIVWISIAVIFTIGYLFLIKWLISDIQNQESSIARVTKSLNFDTIKYGILLTLSISVGIFLINLFTKLAISAFHLSRDANERLQLTHLYLSLINEQAVTTEERGIVLQSLFSRADTGLLKGDSSPTIPDNGLIGQLLKMKNS